MLGQVLNTLITQQKPMKPTSHTYVILLSLLSCSNPFAENYYTYVHTLDYGYCYDTTMGYPNQCLTIDDLSFKDQLLAYYDKHMNHKEASYSFPLNTIGVKTKLYILGYTEDPTLVNIIFYQDPGSYNYYKGYVPAVLLHSEECIIP